MCGGHRPGFGHRHVERGPHSGERCAQLVRGVGDELALERERALEPVEQLVEGVCELLELVVGAGEVQALVQVGGGDLPGGCRDRAQRPQEPPGHQPTDREREPGHDRQGDRGGDQQLMPVGAVLRDAGRRVLSGSRTAPACATTPPVLLCHTTMVTANRTAPDARKTAKNRTARRTRIVRRARRGRKPWPARSGRSRVSSLIPVSRALAVLADARTGLGLTVARFAGRGERLHMVGVSSC